MLLLANQTCAGSYKRRRTILRFTASKEIGAPAGTATAHISASVLLPKGEGLELQLVLELRAVVWVIAWEQDLAPNGALNPNPGPVHRDSAAQVSPECKALLSSLLT